MIDTNFECRPTCWNMLGTLKQTTYKKSIVRKNKKSLYYHDMSILIINILFHYIYTIVNIHTMRCSTNITCHGKFEGVRRAKYGLVCYQIPKHSPPDGPQDIRLVYTLHMQ